MRKFTLSILSVCSVLTLSAQNKFDNEARNMLEDYAGRVKCQSTEGDDNTMVCAIVTLTDASALPRFEALGLDISDVIDDMVIVDFPLSKAEQIAALDYVKHISFGGKAAPVMDMARPASFVSDVQEAIGLEKSYTGAGVITSLFDSGLDPNHINFKNADGSSRVIGVVTVKGSAGATTYYESKRQLSGFTTENANSTHGTHVLGIMSGSYNGAGINGQAQTDHLPYYGVATGSDIVVGCGDLFNTNVLKSVKYALDKGEENGKPVVVNLSLSGNSGPHDGSDSFSKVLDSYGEKAIIVVAAGNDGDIPMGISKTFTSDDNTLKTFLLPHVVLETGGIINSASTFSGNVSFYSSDNRPFKFSIVVYTKLGSKIVSEYTVSSTTSGKKTYIGGSGTSYLQLDKFDNATSASSYLSVSSNVGTDNDRYSTSVDFNLSMANSSSAYYLGFVIEGEDGQKVDGYANSSLTDSGIYASFSSRNRSGWVDGSADGSINTMACGKNLICIGSYNTRKSWPVLSGGNYSYTGTGFSVGEISPFSSYGTLYNGRTLPDLCAPGCGIVASYNTYYVTSHTNQNKTMSASVTSGSKTYYWGNNQGTSMATPYAAGTFALWLEADPTLNVDEIRQIAKSTAYTDSYVANGNAVQWGAGKIDALAGIKKVLDNKAGVGTILADDERNFILTPVDGGYNVYVAGETALTVSLYDTAGRVVAEASADGNSVDVTTSGLRPGVYVLSATGRNQRHTAKIAVK